MKTTIAILFLFLYGLALLKPAFPLIEYYSKMEIYLANCTNKKRPELHCNGQCILMQKLNAINQVMPDSPSPPAPAKINFEDYPIGFIDEFTPVKSPGASTNDRFAIAACIVFSCTFENAIFHPPSVSV